MALVEPPGMVTLSGTVATDVSLLDSATTTPPAGAIPFRVTVATEEEKPPVTVDGFNVSDTSTGGTTVSDADCDAPLPEEAVTVTVVELMTGVVVTVKLAVVAPAATVTVPLPGTAATAALLLERETTAPPAGAGPFRFTVPLEEVPPVTLVGFTASDETKGGITVSEAVWDPPA